NYDEQKIIEAIFDRTVPNLFTDIEVVIIEDKHILKITVEKTAEIISTTKGNAYRRLGRNTKPYHPSEYSSNKISGFERDYSANIIKDSTKEDIDFIEVENLKRKLQSRDKDSTLYNLDDISFLKDLELLKVEDDELKLTVAGVLFVGTEAALK